MILVEVKITMLTAKKSCAANDGNAVVAVIGIACLKRGHSLSRETRAAASAMRTRAAAVAALSAAKASAART